MKVVLIISSSLNEQKMMEEYAQREGLGNDMFLNTTASFGQETQWWIENSPDALVIPLPEEEMLQGFFFQKIKADVPRNTAILFICKNVPASFLALSNSHPRIRILKTPVTGEEVFKTIQDLTAARDPGKQQMHPRYETILDAKVICRGRDEPVTMTIKNLSLSGAYLEYAGNDAKVGPGDRLSIQIKISDKKDYELGGDVIWARPLNGLNGVCMGIRFINKDDELNKLLR